MTSLLVAVALASHSLKTPAVITVQYLGGYMGKAVRLTTDEGTVTTFAGKLGFRDAHRAWCSVCAAVHNHISESAVFDVAILGSTPIKGRIAAAGNIVARYFNEAKTPEQCAGLQLAAWEVLEDGGDAPDFFSGHFAVRTDPITLSYANRYYGAAATPNEAVYLHATDNRSQSQLSTQF